MQVHLTKIQGVALRITNFMTNTRKVAKDRRSAGYLTARKTLLESYWMEYNTCYEELRLFAATAEKGVDVTAVNEYLSKDDHSSVEMLFTENLGELIDDINALRTESYNITTNAENSTNPTTVCVQQMTTLPRIKIPTFDGNFLHWYAFKDLFESVVSNHSNLSNTQRLQYLKDALIGDAEHVLDNIVTTDANFQVAWDILVKKYENKRIIINSYLTQIMNLPKVDAETASQLRVLCDGVTAALRALQHLGRSVSHWDDWLVFIIVNKLDVATRKAWELSLSSSDEVPTFEQIKKFLENRIQSLEVIKLAYDEPQKAAKPKTTVKGYHTSTATCPICSDKHIVQHCKQFKASSAKKELVMCHKLCFNCLRQGHMLRVCPSEGRCTVCKAKHNTLLHGVFCNKAEPNVAQKGVSQSNSADSSTTNVTASITANNTCIGNTSNHSPASLPTVLLATAFVEARGPNGHRQILRVLIDNGAEATFISEFAARQMQLQRTVVKIPISGASGTSVACAKALAKVTIRSLQYDFEMECIALVLPRVGNITPSKHIPNTEFPELGQLKLADPKWYQPGAIDIIMSAADYAMIIRNEVKQSATNGMVAQHTQLGWIIFGGLSDHKGMADTHKAQCYNTHIDLEHTLRLFWELEELNEHQTLTEDEVYCEKLFEQTTRRNSLGRYIVKLPVRKGVDLQQLAPSKQDALVLLEHTHRRLAREPELSTGYNKFMEEYRKLGHMEVSNDNNAIRMCYLPHHGVWKASSTTTKLRVVFNAARKYSTGVSLNDCLYTGP
ncbi:PREDICTED: uncharacterized protein LOC108377541 [Rhagoletis zephyria]|uniref:uncharacterized protein LOC108377541 n=1 Tax=Rhagoletis zephyria TaxID=28612 RepID=UPI0008112330|nr:PREDICTED: uncharacterized protein LOC108377541 [Rhagoletis zephyria]